MTLTYTQPYLGTTAVDTNWDFFQVVDQNAFALDPYSAENQPNMRSATFKYAGSSSAPVSLTYRITLDSKKVANPRINVTGTLRSMLMVADSVTGLTTPFIEEEYGWFYKTSLLIPQSAINIRHGLDSAYFMSAGSIASGVPGNTMFAKFANFNPIAF